ncbi:MAG: exodeoxyribonuclease VII large subunit [Parachlamydiaceae bacterium]|nr:exodeoxyribonuclease VII large subunit [Parachlamydiaceae bacterium]
MTTTPSQEMPVLTVSQLTQAIKISLESTFPSIWLQGEVSNCKLQSSGHLYFSLKDPNAQISAIMFRGDLSSVKTMPKDGAQVIIRGEINVFPPSGKYQIIVREMRLAGMGELLLRLEELKLKLHKRGWFKSEHKKPLPKFPQRIGVVTSPTGAVIQDILNILSRRSAGFHLILNPVRVQGEGAAQEIAQAIAQFNTHHLADVLIVGRGGGSIEDLWAFNEEIVAEAIFNSTIPIISAVGHETDHCIADYVADVRAPTPSAAAEIVTAEKRQQLLHLDQTKRRLQQCVKHLIRQDRHRLEGLRKHPIFQSPYTLLGPWMQRLDVVRSGVDSSMQQLLMHYRLRLEGMRRQQQGLRPSAQIAHLKQKLLQWDKELRNVMLTRLAHARKLLQQKNDRLIHGSTTQLSGHRRLFNAQFKQNQLQLSWNRLTSLRRERLTKLTDSLHAVNPKNVLTKGYCILFAEKTGSVITSIKDVKVKQEVRTLLADGSILSTIKDTIASD